MRLWVFVTLIGAVACLPQRPEGRVKMDDSKPRKPLAEITSVSAGMLHSCALDAIGRVMCWGEWQTRTGDTIPTPAHVLQSAGVQLRKVKQIAAGGGRSCAVTTDDNVKCWGGVISKHKHWPTFLNNEDSTVLNKVAQVSVGTSDICIVTMAGEVNCWKWRWSDGNSIPIEVLTAEQKPLTDIVQVAVSYEHTCALTKSGNVMCWGKGDEGELGNGTNETSALPVAVIDVAGKPLADIVQIATGSRYSCALHKSGNVKCWGRGNIGQLGSGDNKNSNRAIDVMTAKGKLADIVQLGAGITHSCALTKSGNVMCWGAGKAGQMGIGIDGVNAGRKFPVYVTTGGSSGQTLLSDIKQIAVGGLHTCALTNTSNVMCWGEGNSGQLGYGTDKDGKTHNRYRAVFVRAPDEE